MEAHKEKLKLSYVFLDSLNLYILGLQTTKILIRSTLCFALFNFLCYHFALVSEPKVSLTL